MRTSLLLFICLLPALLFAQKASIKGTVTDAGDNSTLIGVNVVILGTTKGTSTDLDGKYLIENLNAGQYNVEFSYLGYEKKVFTGIEISDGQEKVLDVTLGESTLTIDQEVVIIGSKPLVDVEDAKSQTTISTDVIESSPNQQLQSILNTQAGVVQNPEGLYIRGGRTYETGFYIDGVSARDPLAGTGFGIDLGTNSINEIEVSTSSSDVEFGDATSGIINTKTRSGSDKYEFTFAHKRDNFGFNKNAQSTFNNQIYELAFGGPMKLMTKFIPGKFNFFVSAKTNFSDEFIKLPADQVVSSIYPNDFWSPYQDNRWSTMFKINYEFDPRKKLFFSYLKSLTINQNVNMLRITGNDVSFNPGYQYLFSLQPDNANTYTHDTNLETFQWNHTVSNRFAYKIQMSRLYVHLRADANGRDWRPETVDSEFDPRSIVEFPTEQFNTDDSIVFVNPAPGLYNNDGIATLWHDHYVIEYTAKATGTLYSKSTFNRLVFGMEHKYQEMQWIDIIRPWIGAPITLPNGETTQSFRLGDISDAWKVRPNRGAFFVADKIKFRGLIAEVGGRLEYWFPGSYVDNAVANPNAPIPDEIRDAYLDNTLKLGSHRFKLRFLPKVSASFPIRENQMLFFNYSHSTVPPHPSFIYTGLDPLFADRSQFGRVGNPNLNPEVDISYEIGLKSQITLNDALNVTAFWRDKYDFITTASIQLIDAQGREVNRTIRINSDYARVRGIEIAYIKRIKDWFNGQVSISYSVATGQSSSSSESLQDIISNGIRESTKETPLAWDSPLDFKAFGLFKLNNEDGLFGVKGLNKMSLYIETIFRTGRRYTPYVFEGYEPVSGRPIYEVESDPEKRFSKIGAPLWWVNVSYKKWFDIKKMQIAFTLEIRNLINRKNAAIINPVTGNAYEYGDSVPSTWQDPLYLDPRDPRSSNPPALNPARYHEQIHVMFGLLIHLR